MLQLYCLSRLPVLALLAALGATACHNPGARFMTNEDDSATIQIKERADPRQAYRIVMTIQDAPGPFAQVEGGAKYDVVNHNECGEINRVAGTISRIDTMPPIRWEKLSETEYAATVYADLMVDEDYYGRGVCRWKFSYASAMLRATGDQRETRFLPSIDAEEIRSGQSVTWYFWKGYYPHVNIGSGNFPDSGQKDLSNVPAEKRQEFFVITLIAKEAQL